MNELLTTIGSHPSKRISDTVRGNPAIIDLTVGVSDFGPPPRFTREMIALLSSSAAPLDNIHTYTDSRGHVGLRRAIANRYRDRYGLEVNYDTQVLITHGGAEAIWLCIYVLTNPGDAVLIPDPGYMLYAPIVQSLGRKPIYLRTAPADGFLVESEAIVQAANEAPKLLLLNSPANPTGTVYPRETLETIAGLARHFQFFVMHDEVFDDLTFGTPHLPLSAVSPASGDNVVMVNSFSKRYGMTGWRVGWLVAAPHVLREMAKAHTYQALAVATAIQQALAIVLADPDSERYVQTQVKLLKTKLDEFTTVLHRIQGFRFQHIARGGFYLFPEVSELARRFNNSLTLAQPAGDIVANYLLQHCQIAVVPGSAFGPAGGAHVRISVAGSETQLRQAAERLERHLT